MSSDHSGDAGRERVKSLVAERWRAGVVERWRAGVAEQWAGVERGSGAVLPKPWSEALVRNWRADARLLSSLVVVAVLDVLTSAVGVTRPGIVETNPVAAWGYTILGPAAFLLYYLGLGTVSAVVLGLLPLSRAWLRRGGWLAVAVLLWTVVGNLFVIATHW
jgi:hypothetical protein